ncbi:MAG: class I SAM-dependent methyltransferase [Gammaproteobacteria bacterium]|nr:class I SAM-dependent methyltransferase [Gammaproteobacteria bacterium]MBU1969115.1 class I SAM-dependent methyltransferase [Gammaproteobacteria bacterium]
MNPLLKHLPPSAVALILQLTAFVIVVFSIRLFGLHPAPIISALLCGALAATFSYFIGLARWWLFIQFLFAPALVLMLALAIPPGFFLAAFLVMLVVYWSTFRTQVPLYLSSDKVWQALETQLPAGQPFTFVDLGSGLGGVLTHLARTHPQGSYLGVEAAPLPFLWSWLRIRLGGYRNCKVQWGSLWDCDLSKHDVVFAYLSPVPMERLWHKAKEEMRSGSLFISSTFPVPDCPPQKTITVDDLHHSTLHIWQM